MVDHAVDVVVDRQKRLAAMPIGVQVALARAVTKVSREQSLNSALWAQEI